MSLTGTGNLAVEGKGRKGDPRPLVAPGGYWEYNDVRVNRLSLALLRRFRQPLPEVFAERIIATDSAHHLTGPGMGLQNFDCGR